MSYDNTVLFTINGFMGDMWLGPQADTGKALSDQGLRLAYWQPVGFNSSPVPLSSGVNNGLIQLQHQFQLHMIAGMHNILTSSWSEGSIIATLAYLHSYRGDPGWPPLEMWKGATTFGNPYRQKDNWAPRSNPGAVPNPGGSGIGGTRNNLGEGTNPQTPDWWHNYAHPGDMYTCCPNNDIGEAIRIIFDFVLTQWNGLFSDLMAFVYGMQHHVIQQLGGIIGAIAVAIGFYGGGTKEHVNYDPHPSMNYLAGIARNLP